MDFERWVVFRVDSHNRTDQKQARVASLANAAVENEEITWIATLRTHEHRDKSNTRLHIVNVEGREVAVRPAEPLLAAATVDFASLLRDRLPLRVTRLGSGAFSSFELPESICTTLTTKTTNQTDLTI